MGKEDRYFVIDLSNGILRRAYRDVLRSHSFRNS